MIPSILLDGTTATMTISGITNTGVFRTNVDKVLWQAIRRSEIIGMDNRGTHKKPGTLALIAAAGAETRFLPAYSPSPTQIGKMGNKLKALLRKAVARAPEQFDEAIGSALNQIARNGARGWLAS